MEDVKISSDNAMESVFLMTFGLAVVTAVFQNRFLVMVNVQILTNGPVLDNVSQETHHATGQIDMI